MQLKNPLILLFLAIFLWVTYIVVDTSIQSNLVKEWDLLSSIP